MGYIGWNIYLLQAKIKSTIIKKGAKAKERRFRLIYDRKETRQV